MTRSRAERERGRFSTYLWASILAVVVIAGLLVYVLIPFSPPQTPSPVLPLPDATPTTSYEGATILGAQDGICPDRGAADVSFAPPVVTWQLLDTMAVPSGEDVGPYRKTDDVSRCFAHSPGGALVSVAWFVADLAAATVQTRPDLVKLRVAREQGYQALLDQVTEQRARMTSALPPGQSPNAAARLQFTGYRWVDYGTDRATVEIVYRITSGDKSGAMASATYTTVWTGRDWKLVFPTSGRIAYSPVSSLIAYVQWGGV